MKLLPKKQNFWAAAALSALLAVGCQPSKSDKSKRSTPEKEFNYTAESFSDIRILRYKVPGFDELSVKQKELLYYLSQAALSGRDIMWDQNYKHNLTIRRILEEIVKNYSGDKNTEDYHNFVTYMKRVWFSNGIHHHYSNDKFIPEFSEDYFRTLVSDSPSQNYPTKDGETVQDLVERMIPVMFDPELDAKKVNLDNNLDLVRNSAINFYDNLTQREASEFYEAMIAEDHSNSTPVSYGLNSKLVRDEDGNIKERVYKVGGLYGEALEKVVYWLKKASDVAEDQLQKETLELLVEYYETGDLEKFNEYNIKWVQSTEPVVDVINGFIEVYNDPLGRKGSFESVVSIKDMDATKKYGVLSEEAGWFEKNSPIMEEHKKDEVKGVSYKVINVVMESGDSSPSTPIGINLPNENWIRSTHGSKSVSLGNIEEAYAESSKSSGYLEEFYLNTDEYPLHQYIKDYSKYADKLTTGLHEVVGHASGKIEEGVGTPSETLGSYASALEEGRADLVALYYIGDQHLVELGLTPSTDVMKAEYTTYITNGLMTQLTRIELGKNIEEAHMRNRQMISRWAYEKGKSTDSSKDVIERKDVVGEDGVVKTYFVVNDYQKLREIFGDLLRLVQKIKSKGLTEEGKNLIENYGVVPDPELHKQVKERWKKLNRAPYGGFINPHLTPIKNESNGAIVDVRISYPDSFQDQMLYYAHNYSYLPNYN